MYNIKEFILTNLCTRKGYFRMPKTINKFLEENNDYIKYINNAYSGISFMAKCYLIKCDLIDIPKCKGIDCQLNAKFENFSKGFHNTCGKNICRQSYKSQYIKNKNIENNKIEKQFNFNTINFNEKYDNIELKNWLSLNVLSKSKRYKNMWFINNNHHIRLNQIYSRTNYLKKSDPLLKRLQHIQLDICSEQVCKICKKSLYNFWFKHKSYKSYICNSECNKKYKSIINKLVHTGRKHSEQEKINRANAIRGSKRTSEQKHTMSLAQIKSMSRPELLLKIKNSRIKNGSNKKQSLLMKEKIKNGEFTPCITNSWANSKCRLKIEGFNKFYRSSWDAAFQILNPDCEYETLRIQYISPKDNQKHNYIVDFIDRENKIIYEIKPESNKDNEIVKAKENAAKIWCEENNYKFKFISNDWFKENANKIIYEKYDDKIKKGMKQFL